MQPDYFLEIPPQYTALDRARFVVLPIAYDETASYVKGTAEAPRAIIAASQQLEPFDETLLDGFWECGIHTAPEIDGRGLSPEKLQQVAYETARRYVDNGKTLIAIGGEHSVSFGPIRAAAEKHPGLSVLHIDAHADLRDEYIGGSYSHACIMRRVHDLGIPFVSVGIRSFEKTQHDLMVSQGLRVWTPAAIAADPQWILHVMDQLSDKVYITFDIDGLDPSIAPGTGTPEPDGLTYRQAVDLIFAAGRSRQIVGADLVEVIPGVCGVMTEFMAARLVYKMIVACQLFGR